MQPNPKSSALVIDPIEIKKFLDKSLNSKLLSLEFLISGQWLIFSISYDTDYGVFQLSIKDRQILNDFLHKFIGFVAFWNSKEQYKLFKTADLAWPSKFLDVSIASYLENTDRKVDFVSLSKQKLNLDVHINSVENSGGDDIFGDEPNIDPNQLAQNNQAVYNLAEQYLIDFDEITKNLWVQIESPLAPVLAKMELAGVFINRSELRTTGQELSKKAGSLELEINRLLDSEKINLNSPSQLAEALIDKGFNLNKKGASGKLSLDKNVLDTLLLEDESGLIEKILEYRSLTKLLSTYTENLIALLDSDDRLHCQFNQTQAATGRISSNSPNLQNIPIRNQEYGGQIRSCFAVPVGKVMISADYSQIELRLLAHYTNDPILKEAFELNQDIHRRTAAEIFDVPLDQITSQQRSLGKTLNFALLYQQGSFATARQLGISMSQAKEFMEKYFTAFSSIKPFIDQVLSKAKETGYTESLCGRRRHFKYLNSTNKILMREDQRAAFNMVLQGSNADLIKIAMIEIDKQITEQKLDAVMTLQVHDELVFEVSQKDADKVTKLIQEAMSNPPMKLNVNISVDAKTGQNWAEC